MIHAPSTLLTPAGRRYWGAASDHHRRPGVFLEGAPTGGWLCGQLAAEVARRRLPRGGDPGVAG